MITGFDLRYPGSLWKNKFAFLKKVIYTFSGRKEVDENGKPVVTLGRKTTGS